MSYFACFVSPGNAETDVRWDGHTNGHMMASYVWNIHTKNYYKKFELMLTRRAKACSQTISLSPAISSRLLRGTALWCPRVVSLNLENRDLDHRNLRSMLKISCAACPCLAQLILAQFALKMCLAAQNCQKIHKNPILAFKVIEFGGNREPVYDFLLVINCNLGPISPHCWDTATYWLKITDFSHPLSFSVLVRGNPPLNLWKSFTVPETRVFQVADGEDLVILSCTVFDWFTRVTDRQTDGKNCDG